MSKVKIDIRPFIIKVGVVVALSFAGFIYSRLRARSRPSQPPRSSDHDSGADIGEGKARFADDSYTVNRLTGRYEDRCMVKIAVENSTVVLSPGGRPNGDTDGYLSPEFNDLVKECDFTPSHAGISPKENLETARSDVENPKVIISDDGDDCEQEIRHLKNVVKMLQERERNLEVQLLEFYGLKEKETAVMELQNSLKIQNMEAKFLNLKIESLQSDNQRLLSQVAEKAKVVAELDAASAKVKMLKKKLRFEAEQNKEQILSLQRRVSRLQEQELTAVATDSDAQVKLQRLKELESEAEELRNSNLRLQSENSELARQLDSTQVLANSVLEDPETEALRQVSNQLKRENTELAKEIERLQSDKCVDVEELVYLRWVNACLRYELRNFQPSHGKTVARDLSKSLSPKSEEKVKQLILEYANTEGVEEKETDAMDFESYQWSSSQGSCATDSGEYDDSFLPSKSSSSGKMKFLKRLKRLVRGKDVSSQDNGSSLGPEDPYSPCGSASMSTTTDLASDLQPNKLCTPSPSLSRHSSRHSSRRSMDFQRLKSPKMADIKDVENNDLGCSFGARRTSSSRDFTVVDQDPPSFEKAELIKFAQVLKDSKGRMLTSDRLGKKHKRSASVGTFETASQKHRIG